MENHDTNFNNYAEGIYFCGGTNLNGFTNVPDSADNGFLICFGFDSSVNVMQIWIGLFKSQIKYRVLKRSTSTWTDWTTITKIS